MKRVFIPIIAAVCVLGLTACGDSEKGSSSSQSTAAQTEAQQEQTTEAAQSSGEDKTAPVNEETEPEVTEASEARVRIPLLCIFLQQAPPRALRSA